MGWGLWVVMFPNSFFDLIQIQRPLYPQIWQCVGMIVGVYGIGYFIASNDPRRHWPIVLVGLMGKVFGPIGFMLSDGLPTSFGMLLVFNDLMWWIPFAWILYETAQYNSNTSSQTSLVPFEGVLRSFRSNRGSTMEELSNEKPLMIVFLRHMGCTFCREAMKDMGERIEEIEASGVELAIVHMSPPMTAAQTLEKYGLYEVHRFSDPKCLIYEAFQVERGNPVQLFGPKVWWRGLIAGLFGGHGIGKLAGDGFRLPGVFMLQESQITQSFRANSAADRPDYVRFANSFIESEYSKRQLISTERRRNINSQMR